MSTKSIKIKKTFWQLFCQHKLAYYSLYFLFFIAILALFAPWIAPYPYHQTNVSFSLQSPSSQFWFGTDTLGRDLFSRILFGARISLAIGLLTAVFSLCIGVIYGGISGWFGGKIDAVMMRIADILYTLPFLLITILLMLVFGRGPIGLFFALGIVGWIKEARIVRAQVMQAKSFHYVEAAKAIGQKPSLVFLYHILPNVMVPLLVSLSFSIPQNILAESFLSFIGIGLEPPHASWGTLANEGWRAYRSYPHLIFFPGIVLFLSVLAFNFLGDGIQDAVDPKRRRS